MAKYNFTNGFKVFSHFFKVWFGYNPDSGEYTVTESPSTDDPKLAGHLHDGVNDNGHCGRIVLDDRGDGQSRHCVGKLPGANIAASKQTITGAAVAGVSGLSGTANLDFSKIDNMVFLRISGMALSGSTHGEGASITTTGLRSEFKPAQEQLVTCYITGAITGVGAGYVQIDSSGAIALGHADLWADTYVAITVCYLVG